MLSHPRSVRRLCHCIAAFSQIEFHGTLPIEDASKYNDGTFRPPPKYAAAEEFLEERAIVHKNGKWGAIDVADDQQPAPHIHEHDAGDSMASGKWGFVDREGNLTIPARFDTADDFQNGLAHVWGGSDHGFIDKTGVWVFRVTIPW